MRKRKFPLIEDFFDVIDSEIKAYFLGLLYADGCNHTKGNSISIALQEKDKYILEKLKDSIYTVNKPLTYKKAQTERSSGQYVLSIHGEEISKRLEEYGMTARKSLTLKFPNNEVIPDYLLNHFIRGYFDGDGCISTDGKKNSIVKFCFYS